MEREREFSTNSGQFFKRSHGHEGLSYQLRLCLRAAKGSATNFFETYQACVLTLRNELEWLAPRELLDLSLKELTESTFGDIFPLQEFWPSPTHHVVTTTRINS